jgi:GNAT superfamily N-acetyltransferase
MSDPTLLKTYTLRERPELEPSFDRLAEACWPVFMRQRDELGTGELWPSLFTDFAEWQVAVCGQFDRVVAVGHAIPFVWDGRRESLPTSIAAIMRAAAQARAAGRPCNALSALAALVDPRHRGAGLSRRLLSGMAQVALRHGLVEFVAPVRPTLKASYPLVPMERYVRWTDGEGQPFDPWMRVHARLGAAILDVMPRAMVIVGPVERWEEWTGMRFPESGAYVVPGALQPVAIDRERNEGRYEDPNVWMRHPLAAGEEGAGTRPETGRERSRRP